MYKMIVEMITIFHVTEMYKKNCPNKFTEFALFLTHYFLDKCIELRI